MSKGGEILGDAKKQKTNPSSRAVGYVRWRAFWKVLIGRLLGARDGNQDCHLPRGGPESMRRNERNILAFSPCYFGTHLASLFKLISFEKKKKKKNQDILNKSII